MTDDVLEALHVYVEQLLQFPDKEIAQPMRYNESEQQIFNQIHELHHCLFEMYQIANQIAEGNLKQKITNDNRYIGGLKDLQSSLKFLIYQINRIAEGDYSIGINFLGDFSQTFEHLIAQLKERETILKENATLNEQLARQQEELLKHEMKRSTEKYNRFVSSVMDIRSYRHDMQNHLLCMEALLQSQDVQGAQDYISSLIKDFASAELFYDSQNYILDVLLNEKLERAREMHVNIHKNIMIERTLKIENKDWCIFIGNALDNSLEALKQVPVKERELSVLMQQKDSMLSVKIENTMKNPIRMKNNIIETTKADKVNHGIGLKNIQKAVQKYHGVVEIKTEAEKFSLILLLMNV